MPIEDHLLFSLVGLTVNNRFLPTIQQLLTQKIDWNYVIGKAIHNRIIPILNHALQTIVPTELRTLIPPDFLIQVHTLNYVFTGHSLVFHEEAKTILKSFSEATVVFTPIKGIVFDQTIYPTQHLRFFSDIDLLFPNRTELQRAEQLLLHLGYTHVFSNAREAVYRKYRHGQSIHCDLHHSLTLFNFFEYPTIGELWHKTSEETISGVTVKVMSPEYMLLVLCLHSFLHGSFSLLDLSDTIHLFSKYPNFDWPFLVRHLSEYPCSFGLPLTLIKHIIKNYYVGTPLHKTTINLLTDEKKPIFQIKDILGKQSFADRQYPLPYSTICKRCVDYTSCPIVPFIHERIKLQEQHTPRLRDYLPLGYYELKLILTMIRKKYGIKYTLKCIYHEFTGIFTYLITILKSHLFTKPESPLENKQ